METLQNTAAAGTKAVKRLRLQKLRARQPFMINSKSLPLGQFYIEYPSGIIQLAAMTESKRDYVILRELDVQEATNLRLLYGLY
jgi:hypothetical protein